MIRYGIGRCNLEVEGNRIPTLFYGAHVANSCPAGVISDIWS